MTLDAPSQPMLAPVLLVSDLSSSRQKMRGMLETWSLSVQEADDVTSAMMKILYRGPHCAVICDDLLPDGSAHDFVRLLHDQGFETPVLIVSNASAMNAMPLHEDDLWEALDTVLEGGLTRLDRALDELDAAMWTQRRHETVAEHMAIQA